ncbi:uncharacterized protein V1518DRAFT_84160 [Limtongia smithiae]|uniref:uncharacterized protein n=1 Tax=Limtongia smithiae TaxID=1125753 RepID=UPI0034CF91D5
MLKSRRLTALLSQALTPLAPPIDTFHPDDAGAGPADENDDDGTRESAATSTATTTKTTADTGGTNGTLKSPLPHPHTPRIVTAVLFSAGGNLLAAASLNGNSHLHNHTGPYSLALSPSVSQVSTSSIGATSLLFHSQPPPVPLSPSANGAAAIHLVDLTPRPRILAAYAAAVWRSYDEAIAGGDLFPETSALERDGGGEDPDAVEWIAIENEESTIVVHSVLEGMLVALMGERGAPVGLLYARTNAVATTLGAELKGFSFE